MCVQCLSTTTAPTTTCQPHAHSATVMMMMHNNNTPTEPYCYYTRDYTHIYYTYTQFTCMPSTSLHVHTQRAHANYILPAATACDVPSFARIKSKSCMHICCAQCSMPHSQCSTSFSPFALSWQMAIESRIPNRIYILNHAFCTTHPVSIQVGPVRVRVSAARWRSKSRPDIPVGDPVGEEHHTRRAARIPALVVVVSAVVVFFCLFAYEC